MGALSLRSAITYAVGVVVALLAAWVIVAQPFDAGSPGPSAGAAASTSATSQASPARPTTSRSATSCRAGEPARLLIPALDVDAAFARIGLDQQAKPDADGRRPLGNPTDRTKAGWYADGPKPGSGRGTVLANGHTYRDNSAIFKEDFAERIDVGQVIHVEQDNGSTCSYRVTRIWREVDAAREYPRIVVSEQLYNFEGPERLFLTTCGGSWNSLAQDYDDISLLIATPVNRD
jgi:hypothetical protein